MRRRRGETNKIVEEGIIISRRENNKIEGKYNNCGGGNKKLSRETWSIKDSVLSLTILIDSFKSLCI